jgi:hypothetical protein
MLGLIRRECAALFEIARALAPEGSGFRYGAPEPLHDARRDHADRFGVSVSAPVHGETNG